MAAHFTSEAMKFLRGLARHNDREWFEARRPIYEAELKAPMLALVEEINAAMAEFAPEHVRPPQKIAMRIYRDTRFSKDKRPYKTHLAAWWARRGMEKTSGAGFYLHIDPQEVLIAAGVYMPDREQLLALRQWMAAHHQSYRAAVQQLVKPAGRVPRPPFQDSRFQEIEADGSKRMPRGFAADHPAGELLRARNWGVRLTLPAEIALQPSLPEQIARRFRLAAPLVNQLNSAILETKPAANGMPGGALSRRL